MSSELKKSFEVNFDGLVGPTHNYSGLSHGNIASSHFKGMESNPLEAVLQGLGKMKTLSDAGFLQGVLAPQARPDLGILKKMGFTGTDKNILSEVCQNHPALLSAVTSASSMWAANAATVSPSADAKDHRVHFTPANLVSKFHRSLETPTTARILKKIFKDPQHFAHHDPLPPSPAYADEGAANHTRLCADYGQPGIEFFVYGRGGLRDLEAGPKKFPARQTKEACEALARTHLLDGNAVVYAQQTPEAIDAGVFHNDVIGVGNRDLYFYHEKAYVNSGAVIEELQGKFKRICGETLNVIEIKTDEVSLEDVVKSYLFNSQLLGNPDGSTILVAPAECEEIPSVAAYLKKLTGRHKVVSDVKFLNLRQSMRNGGGPACLRLRVVLEAKELKAVNQKVLMNEKLYGRLVTWAKKHYRDRLTPEDLGDPELQKESKKALDELTRLLGLGFIYEFQKG